MKKEEGLNYTMVRIDKEKLTAIAYKDWTLNIQPFDMTRVDNVVIGDRLMVLHHPEGSECVHDNMWSYPRWLKMLHAWIICAWVEFYA